MKRLWAVLLTAALLAGCRSSQPTTNPFMRTTVAPPATTSGVIVTPGQPMAQGISPPMITSPAPPPVTVTPMTQQPMAPVMPVAAPVPVTPNGSKFHPPGGDYLFHQSSHEPPAANAQEDGVQLAAPAQPQLGAADRATQQYTVVQACYAPPSAGPLPAPMQADGTVINPYVKQKPATMQADGTVVNPYVKSKAAAPRTLPSAAPPTLPLAARKTFAPAPPKSVTPTVAPKAKLAPKIRENIPPANLGAISVGDSSQGSTLRIVGQSSGGSNAAAVKPPVPGEPAVLRITAGNSQPALRSTVPAEVAPGANLAIKTQSTQQNSASLRTPDAAPAVVRASFQPAAGTAATGGDYAHSPDYQTLRGKLEYSPSLRQWKLRYIPIDGRTDTYGGSVILPDSPALAGFKAGDVVEIRGALPAARISSSGFAPQYTPTSIERLSR